MRRTVLAAILALILAAPLAHGAAVSTGLVDGGGVLLGGSVYCAHTPAPAPVHLTLVPAGSFEAWDVTIAGDADPICPAPVAARCAGTGRLSTGVEIGDCLPLAGQGTLGPVVVCIPGPVTPWRQLALLGGADFQFANALGSMWGRVRLALLGGAANEAANICL
jgi:hypothetical protein